MSTTLSRVTLLWRFMFLWRCLFWQMFLCVWVSIYSGFVLLHMRISHIIYGLLCCIHTVFVFLCRLGQACNHIAALLFFIENHAKDEILPTEISKTSKPMIWNQPPKKTVAPECSSNMWFVKPSHGDLPVQRISRSTFDPRAMKHQGDVDKERESMPCSGLQHFWCDGPNKRLTLVMSHCGAMYSFHMVP